MAYGSPLAEFCHLATSPLEARFPPRQTALLAGQGSGVPKTALRGLREGAEEVPPREAAERILRESGSPSRGRGTSPTWRRWPGPFTA